jgi:hypothetical protein
MFQTGEVESIPIAYVWRLNDPMLALALTHHEKDDRAELGHEQGHDDGQADRRRLDPFAQPADGHAYARGDGLALALALALALVLGHPGEWRCLRLAPAQITTPSEHRRG